MLVGQVGRLKKQGEEVLQTESWCLPVFEMTSHLDENQGVEVEKGAFWQKEGGLWARVCTRVCTRVCNW